MRRVQCRLKVRTWEAFTVSECMRARSADLVGGGQLRLQVGAAALFRRRGSRHGAALGLRRGAAVALGRQPRRCPLALLPQARDLALQPHHLPLTRIVVINVTSQRC